MNDSMVISFVAGEDLSSSQYKFVMLHTDGTVKACSATTDIPIGVLQNKPTSGQAAEVALLGWTKVQSDAALSIGNVVGTSADGQAAAYAAGTDTTKYLSGIVTKASGAAGDIAEIILRPIARGA